MNATDNLTHECNLLGLYSPGEPPVPAALKWVALVHCYCVIVFGTPGNALALWCVATCTKTGRPMKVLLFSVFLPVVVICLATWPVIGEVWAAHLTCDPDRISKTAIGITMIVYVILSQIELTSIAAIAVVRAAAVWAPHRPTLGIRGAVVLVVVTCIYAILSGLSQLVMKQVADPQIVPVFLFVNLTLPVLITVAAYILIISVIQQNKRRLVACQQQVRVTTTMDQATRAMLAVFISNFVLGLPHSIYLLKDNQPLYMDAIFQVIFSTHYVVDPLAYMWFNSGCREKVLSSVRNVLQFMSLPITTLSLLQTRSTTSCDQQTQHKSSTQVDSNL